MSLHVIEEGGFIPECLTANITLRILFCINFIEFCMCEHVSSEIITSKEGFATYFTRMWLLVRVTKHVSIESIEKCEGFVAHTTLVGLQT